MKAYIIVHGLHKVLEGQIVNYQVIIPRANGESSYRGSSKVGERIEINIDPNEN